MGIIIDAIYNQSDVNWLDIICMSNGWCPLEVGEPMWVTYEGKEYRIERTK